MSTARLSERLRRYSADTMLCNDYADAMQEAADALDAADEAMAASQPPVQGTGGSNG